MGRLSDTMLGDQARGYPQSPGYRAQPTSAEAARAVAPFAANVRDQIMAAFRAAGANGLTADEAGAKVGVDPFTARPRVTELLRMGLICKSSDRRPSSNGRSSIVWVAS